MKHFGMVPCASLILAGGGLGYWGIEVIRQSGTRVSGGPMIWALYFGGSLLFVGCGLWLLIKGIAKREM